MIDQVKNLNTKYIIFGKEKGEINDTIHLQGYLELEKKSKLLTVANLMKKKWHIEPRGGSQEDAINYCKKGEQSKKEWSESKEKGEHFGLNADVFEQGVKTVNHSGKRTDIDNARTLVLCGGMRSLTKVVQSAQALKVAEKFLEYHEIPRNWVTNVIWLYGPSGAGKSRRARELFDNKDIYTKSDGIKWWNGYDGHENVIFDDFRDTWWSITEMLSLLDRYEKRVECKGGVRQFTPKNIIITSIKPPSTFYNGCKNEPIKQLLRRINEIVYINKNYYNDTLEQKDEIKINKLNNKVRSVLVEDLFDTIIKMVPEDPMPEVQGNTRCPNNLVIEPGLLNGNKKSIPLYENIKSISLEKFDDSEISDNEYEKCNVYLETMNELKKKVF
jgi:hypothetical protein